MICFECRDQLTDLLWDIHLSYELLKHSTQPLLRWWRRATDRWRSHNQTARLRKTWLEYIYERFGHSVCVDARICAFIGVAE